MYTDPEDVWQVYKRLSPISHRFTVAAAFGNVHGVYKPGNVHLRPSLLGDCQKYVKEKIGEGAPEKPVFFVFHGGSGSEKVCRVARFVVLTDKVPDDQLLGISRPSFF